MPDFTSAEITDFVRQTLLPILLIVVVAVIALRVASLFVHGIVKALLDREATEGTAQELSAVELKKRMDTLERLVANVLQFFIGVIAALMILDKLGLDIGPAIAGLGVIGIAVGFGAQTLVRDYLTGALILVENQYGVGDVVRLAGVSGTVEDFNLRRTTVRDIDGVVHTIPNGQITVASNLTRVWARINEDVTVAYGTEAGLFQQAGIPAVVCGPGSIDVAHKADEFVPLDQLDACAAFLRRVAQRAADPLTGPVKTGRGDV